MLNRISSFLTSRDILLRIYKRTILPIFVYGRIVWGDCAKQNVKLLERPQNHTMRNILAVHRKSSTQHMCTKLALLSIMSRRRFLRLQWVSKIVHNINCPDQLKNCLVRRSQLHLIIDLYGCYSVRFRRYYVFNDGTVIIKFADAKDWNDLPKELENFVQSLVFKLRSLSISWNWIKSNMSILLNSIFYFLCIFYT